MVAFRRSREEEQRFRLTLRYIASSKPCWATWQSQKKKKNLVLLSSCTRDLTASRFPILLSGSSQETKTIADSIESLSNNQLQSWVLYLYAILLRCWAYSTAHKTLLFKGALYHTWALSMNLAPHLQAIFPFCHMNFWNLTILFIQLWYVIYMYTLYFRPSRQ